MQNIIFIHLFKINNIKFRSKNYRLQDDRVHVIICLYGLYYLFIIGISR